MGCRVLLLRRSSCTHSIAQTAPSPISGDCPWPVTVSFTSDVSMGKSPSDKVPVLRRDSKLYPAQEFLVHLNLTFKNLVSPFHSLPFAVNVDALYSTSRASTAWLVTVAFGLAFSAFLTWLPSAWPSGHFTYQ
ncbi:hypothetical protein BDQ94DRAFT_155972 [Aspergillus welwitschiae]|uniref:Uncharacterized protein n=1 Tax=Aspergillus welwitschiae TaxID=1341132 RepID=A0A3F3PGT2_9EURO|nr:hypothetical protein BDQ94DRAFT_155972 [Aspergillus welwitschiae]RDH26124.1 hypothetical protein BDQ94DRAFT_155972 [Aspergillus welwitschiae]